MNTQNRLYVEIAHPDDSVFHISGIGSDLAISALQESIENSTFSMRCNITYPCDFQSNADAIFSFVEKRIPIDWAKWPIDRRRDFWRGVTHTADGQTLDLVERDRIAAVEIWCELFNGNIKDMKPADTREINAILARLKDWRRSETVIRVGPYSVQRGFVRR